MEEKNLRSEELAEATKEMVEALTHPEYVEAMRLLKSTPTERRLTEAMKRLTPEALRERGVPLPEGMRISSRYFEPNVPAIELGELPSGEKGILRELNDRDPGVLDRLRAREPQVLTDLADIDFRRDVINPYALCVCACGGGGICGGAGGG